MEIVPFLSNFAHDHVENHDDHVLYGWLHGGMVKPGLTMAMATSLSATGKDDAIPNILLREESWGGLIFNAKSESVLQADKEAFSVFVVLKNGATIESLQASANEAELEKLAEFERRGRELGLLP